MLKNYIGGFCIHIINLNDFILLRVIYKVIKRMLFLESLNKLFKTA